MQNQKVKAGKKPEYLIEVEHLVKQIKKEDYTQSVGQKFQKDFSDAMEILIKNKIAINTLPATPLDQPFSKDFYGQYPDKVDSILDVV